MSKRFARLSVRQSTEQLNIGVDAQGNNITYDLPIAGSGLIQSDSMNVADTLYCRKLVVAEEISVPLTNDADVDSSTKSTQINNETVDSEFNTTAGKLLYDATTKSLKISNTKGELKNVADGTNSIIKNTKYKEIILLEGWSPDNGNYISLRQPSGVGIDMSDHVYYQGHGYVVGINKGDAITGQGDTYNSDIATHAYQPVSYMSRIDYFIATVDSISNLTTEPVNFLGFSLINNVEGNVEIEIVNNADKPYLNFRVNSNKETKWFAIINLQKIYIKNATSNTSDDQIKYSTTDNSILFEKAVNNGTEFEGLFRFSEILKQVTIKPVSETNKVTDDTGELTNSIIDNSASIKVRNISSWTEIGNTGTYYPVESFASRTLGNNSSGGGGAMLDYNTFAYFNTLLIQPSATTYKSMASLYGHSMYMLDVDPTKNRVCTFEQLLGNSFTKDSTKDASNFFTSYINNTTEETPSSTNDIRLVYQLKEKEYKYKPLFGISYFKMFSAKRLNDRTDLIAHRENEFILDNTVDINEYYTQKLVLYKKVDQFTANISKYVYLTDRDNEDDNTNFTFKLGTHNFIKSYISIRDVTNANQEVCAFFIHTASIVIPSYSTLREYFLKLRNADMSTGTDSNITTITNNIKSTFGFTFPKYANDQSVTTHVDNSIDIVLTAYGWEGLTYSIDSQPSNGTLSAITDTNTVTYTPSSSFIGNDSFTFKINDGTGISDSQAATINITVNSSNSGSFANNQSAITYTNTPLEIKLTASKIPSSATLTYSIVNQPSNGTLSSITDTNILTYTPSVNYIGNDSFTFKVNDGSNDSQEATISLVVNAYENISNTVYNEPEKNKPDNQTNQSRYNGPQPFEYIETNVPVKKHIDDDDTKTVELVDFDIEIETEPVMSSSNTVNNITGTLEDAYNTFAIQFPLKLKSTSKETAKYQVYVLLEINSFELDTY